jgi:dipeptidyl-peptidase-3
MQARSGLLALEYCSFESGEWRQAHMQARFAILQTLLAVSVEEAEESRSKSLHSGRPFLRIRSFGYDDMILEMNRDKIRTVGLPAIRDLLIQVQVYRATADVTKGTELFSKVKPSFEHTGAALHLNSLL